MSTKNRITRFIDEKAANERYSLTTREVATEFDLSPQSASNALSRFVRDGLLDRVSNGHFAIRPTGSMGTRAAAENVALAVGAAFSGEAHRISHRSALAHHGLIVHPARTIQVSLSREVEIARLSGRKFLSILERAETIEIGRELAGYGAWVSSVNRSILECASRPSIGGGWGAIAQSLQAANFEQGELEDLAGQLNMSAALRRIASIADAMGVSRRKWRVQLPKPGTRPIQLDPRIESEDPWLDARWMVSWPEPAEQMIGGATA